MTILVNDRDVLIQNTVPRFSIPTDRSIDLRSSAQVFKVTAAGAGYPEEITFQARLFGMVGEVVWSASGGSTLQIDGNTAVLRFADMKGGETTVTAIVTVDGQPYPSSQDIVKVSDGIMGNSARRAYTKTSLVALSRAPSSLTTEGDTSYPPPDTWGPGTVWQGSPPQLGVNERLFYVDAIYSPLTNTSTWTPPILASLEVGQLSAIAIDAGRIKAGDFEGVVIHGGPGYPHSTYSWPTNLQWGFHLSADGLLLGNVNLNRYFQATAAGDILTPQFSSIGGLAKFAGELQAATGTIGLLRSRASGGRIEIAGDTINVFNDDNRRKVLIGRKS